MNNLGKVYAQKKELQNNMNLKKTQFINSLTIIINACYFKNKGNETIIDIRNSYMAFKSVGEDIILKYVGVYIWKYKEDIKNTNEEFFLNNNFQDDIDAHYNNSKDSKFSKAEVNHIFSILKTMYPKLNDGEKKTIWTHVGNLLKCYAEYTLCKQQLLKLK